MTNKQYGFFIDTDKCTGCKTCQLSCKDHKHLSEKVNFRRIYEYSGGDWQTQDSNNAVWTQNVFNYYVSISCNHCSDPACVKACPSGAMHKREEDGLVVVNESVCIGCQYCSMACPYGAPQYNAQKGHMTKCDGCFERVEKNLKPVCVESCPLRALDFDEMDVLREKYGHLSDIAPLPSSEYTQPNLIIKTNRNAKPTNDTLGCVANRNEVSPS